MSNNEIVVLDPVAHVEVEPRATAPNLDSLAGKILRINPDGSRATSPGSSHRGEPC